MATIPTSPTNGELTIDDVFASIRNTAVAAWSNTTKKVRVAGGFIIFFILTIMFLQPSVPTPPPVPKVYLDYGAPKSPFNETKVALLVENRSNPVLAPLMLHFMSVVPPDWRFRFMGSEASIKMINQSTAIQHKQNIGKLDLTLIPPNMSTSGREEVSRFFTTLWLYETVLAPAKHLLIFQTDSILCANSQKSLNNWLDYDWVGAPWNPDGRYGGNGGLSLRSVDAIIDVLRNQERLPNSEPEDVWLTERLGARPNAKMANGTTSLTFSAENWSGEGEKVGEENAKKMKEKLGKLGIGQPEPEDKAKIAADGKWIPELDEWRKGFYEPMGYHTGSSGWDLHPPIWGTKELRQHIYDYCPEVKMTLYMDASEYIPGECGATWDWETEHADQPERIHHRRKRALDGLADEDDDLAWIGNLIPF